MKRKLLSLLLVVLLLVSIPGTLLLASDISGALYRMSIVVSNNGTLANYVSTNGVISTPNLIAGGFLNASANNCAVLDKASSEVPFMPGYSTNPWAFWVETIGADSYLNYDLYTADTTGGAIAYFPDITGMIVSDNSTIELGSDFEVEVEGWVDTTLSANKSLVYKQDAFRTYISAEDEITSAIRWGESFPTVEAVNGGNNVVNNTDHTVNLPAGIEAGDLLLVFFASDGNELFTSFPAGWTQLFIDNDANAVTLSAEYRVADGSEGATITVTTVGAQMSAHTSYRITGYSGVPEAGAATNALGANPDPPNLAPSWGTWDTLWFAVTGYDVGTKTVTAWPANYGDSRNDRAAAAEGCGVGNARRELNAANENPGAFTISAASEWIANTVAIAPADLEVTAIGIDSGEYTVKTYGVDNEPVWATGDVLHFTGAADSNVNAGAINDNIAKLWVSLWFGLDSTFSAASAIDQFVWGKFNGAADYVYAYLESDDGKLYFKFDDGVNPFTLTSTTVSWTADTWYHIITSLSDDPAQRLLVNDTAEDTDAVAASNTPNGGDFCFGDFDDPGAVTGFIGEIQNVIIGTDNLTAGEETALYDGTAPGDETDYWYTDEGTGTVITSYGSAANTGTADTAYSWETSTYTTGKTGRLCDFYIEVDDGVTDPDRWGANLKGASVLDNGNDWEIGLNDATPYIYYYKHTVGGVLHAWHEWEYDAVFHDRSYYGLDFDGTNDRVDCGVDSSLSPARITIMAWIKTSRASQDVIHRYIVPGNQRAYDLFINGTVISLAVDADGIAGGGVIIVGSTPVNTDVWTFVVATSDGANLNLYVNGAVDAAPVAFADDIHPSTGTFYIGDGVFTAVDYLGNIDEVWIYNRALGLTEIQANYSSGQGTYTPYSTSGLVGQWHMEEGSGTGAILVDSSGKGNTGTLQGNTAWVNGYIPRPAGSSGTNDATPTFRTASSDADVVATAVSFQPIEEAKAPAWTLSEAPATWLVAANVTGNFTTTPSPTYPGANVIEDIAAASGTPAQLPFIMIFGFVALAISLSVSYVLRQYGSRSIFVKIIVIGLIFIVCVAIDVVDFWMMLFFLIIALAVMAASKPGAVV